MKQENLSSRSLVPLPAVTRVMVPPLLAGGGVAVALLTQFTIAYGDVPYIGLGFVLGALLLGAAVLLESRRRSDPAGANARFELTLGAESVLFALVIALAAFFRFFKFYSFPPGLWYDEGVNGSDAITLIDHDHVRLWFDTVFGRSTLYLYLLAGSFKLFGYSLFAVRIVPAVAGLAAVIAFYFLARHVAGAIPALVATALYAVSRWAVTFSRISWEDSIQPVIEILAIYWFMRAMETKKWWQFALSGLFLGAGLYSYVAFRMVPVVIAVFGLLWLATHWREWRSHVRGLALFVAVFVIAAAPLGIFTIIHTDKVTQRTREVSVFKQIDDTGSYEPLRHNLRAAWRMFNVEGDPNPRHNLPSAPQLDDITAAIFVLGIAVSVWSFRNWRRAGVAPWLVLALIPGVLTLQSENPSAIRALGATPAVFLLAALAVAAVYRVLAASRVGLFAFAFGAVALVTGASAMNYDELFNHQAKSTAVYDAFQAVYTQTAQEVSQRADTNRVYVASLFGHPALTTLAHGKQFVTYHPAADVIFPPGDKDVVIVMDSQQFGVLPTLQRLYPHLSVRDHVDPFGNVYWAEVRIPAADTNAVHVLQVTLHAGGTPDGAMLSAPEVTTVHHEWTASDLGSSGPVTAVWDAYVWIGSVADTGKMTFRAPGTATIEIDGAQVASGTGQVVAALNSLPFGEHSVRLIASISEPGTTDLTTSGGAGDDVLYETSIGGHGFEAVYHADRDFTAAPVMIARYPFAVGADGLPTSQAIEYRAKLSVPAAGEYGFALDGSGAAQLFVDDQLVVDNGGAHPAQRTEGARHLTAGEHTFAIQYLAPGNADWSAFMRPPGQDWKRLDGSEFSVPTEPYMLPSLVTVVPDDSWDGAAASAATGQPSAVTTLADGTVVVASKSTLFFISASGAVLRTVSLPSGVDIDDLATDDAGEIIAGDRANQSVLVMDAAGTVLRTITGPFSSVTGISVNGGDIYVASALRGLLYRVPLAGGAPEELSFAPDIAQPSDIVAMPDGTYIATDFDHKTIVISPDGENATDRPGYRRSRSATAADRRVRQAHPRIGSHRRSHRRVRRARASAGRLHVPLQAGRDAAAGSLHHARRPAVCHHPQRRDLAIPGQGAARFGRRAERTVIARGPSLGALHPQRTKPAHHRAGFVSATMEATTGFEPVMGVLQTPALPLGYVAVSACRRNTNPPGGTRADAAESACGAEEEI